MTTVPYDDHAATAYGDTHAELRPGERAPVGPGVVFLWFAWAIAAVFWLASLQIDVGIIEAVMRPTAGVTTSADVGGVGFALMTIVGVIALGLALAYGMARNASRNRAMDPVTEAATADLYDQVERQGGEDMTTRSPEDRTPQQRRAEAAAKAPKH